MKAIVLVDFSKYHDSELVVEATRILNQMSGNPSYPAPTPTLEELSAGIDNYGTALVATLDGGKKATALKKKTRKELETLLKNLGLYVQIQCKNDLTILLSSGYKAKKARERKGVLAAPKDFKVLAGANAGSVTLKVKVVKGAKLYLYQYTEAPVTSATIWITEAGPRKTTIDKLTSGKQYAFRVAAKGTVKELVYSDVVLHFVS